MEFNQKSIDYLLSKKIEPVRCADGKDYYLLNVGGGVMKKLLAKPSLWWRIKNIFVILLEGIREFRSGRAPSPYQFDFEEDLSDEKRERFIKSTDEYNRLFGLIKADRGWLSKFIRLCKHYYETEPCGGRLHIVLDDGNLEDHHINWASGYASGREDHEAEDIANLMLAMTLRQRKLLYKEFWGHED